MAWWWEYVPMFYKGWGLINLSIVNELAITLLYRRCFWIWIRETSFPSEAVYLTQICISDRFWILCSTTLILLESLGLQNSSTFKYSPFIAWAPLEFEQVGRNWVIVDLTVSRRRNWDNRDCEGWRLTLNWFPFTSRLPKVDQSSLRARTEQEYKWKSSKVVEIQSRNFSHHVRRSYASPRCPNLQWPKYCTPAFTERHLWL